MASDKQWRDKPYPAPKVVDKAPIMTPPPSLMTLHDRLLRAETTIRDQQEAIADLTTRLATIEGESEKRGKSRKSSETAA
jgi:hypothetical protein